MLLVLSCKDRLGDIYIYIYIYTQLPAPLDSGCINSPEKRSFGVSMGSILYMLYLNFTCRASGQRVGSLVFRNPVHCDARSVHWGLSSSPQQLDTKKEWSFHTDSQVTGALKTYHAARAESNLEFNPFIGRGAFFFLS